eukprot:scaffold38243_cov51-Attheya_sp.AAC.2
MVSQNHGRRVSPTSQHKYVMSGRIQQRRKGKYNRGFLRLSTVVTCFMMLVKATGCGAVMTGVSDGVTNLEPILGGAQLGVGAALVLLISYVGIGKVMGMPQLTNALLVASGRCAVQLFVLGAWVLERMFAVTSAWPICAWIVGVGCLAAYDASSRVEFTYPRLQYHVQASVLLGGLIILAIAVGTHILGSLEPWFDPRTLLPVAGMLFGNTLSAAALCTSSLLKGFATDSAELELRLARGASAKEASWTIRQVALSSALTPIIATLSVTGIVKTPGLMTGQILAGASAHQAAAYQVQLLFLITSTTAFTSLLLTYFISEELVNSTDHRLQTSHVTRILTGREKKRALQKQKEQQSEDNIKEHPIRVAQRLALSLLGIRMAPSPSVTRETRKKNVGQPATPIEYDDIVNEASPLLMTGQNSVASELSNTNNETQLSITQTSEGETDSIMNGTSLHFVQDKVPIVTVLPNYHNNYGDFSEAVDCLEVKEVVVKRAHLKISFEVRPGERLGITGASGIGKTQIFKTLIGLEPFHGTSLTLRCGSHKDDEHKIVVASQSWPDWRRRVVWVSQDRAPLEGTPMAFFEEIKLYHAQQQYHSLFSSTNYGESVPREGKDPQEIAQDWGLPTELWHRQWTSLSGGESQRASLAIVLALEPKVLLLDEATSALDKDTQLAVERTLQSLNIPIIMITHSREQLQRFCTHHMDLDNVPTPSLSFTDSDGETSGSRLV